LLQSEANRLVDQLATVALVPEMLRTAIWLREKPPTVEKLPAATSRSTPGVIPMARM
jgi:hypothetical protein